MKPSFEKRWAAIWLSRLSTDRLARRGDAPADRPFATVAKDSNRVALAAVNRAASEAGLAPGLMLADARARIPALAVTMADEAADRAFLDSIAAWCERFTPVVALDPPDGLFLDLSGCAHLFGGEAALRATIVTRLEVQGLSARAAIGPTPGAAWALARFGETKLVGAVEAAAALAPLPVAALRLEPEAEDLLRRLGLVRIGQILKAPRAPLAARLGEATLRRLDQALGRASEALDPRRPPPPVFADRRFLEPLTADEALLIAVADAAREIERELERRAAGARRMVLELFPVSGAARAMSLGLSAPTRAPQRLVRLFREKFAALTAPLADEFGVESIRLSAFRLERIEETLHGFAEDARSVDIGALVDSVAARLGPHAALKPVLRTEHLPERAGACAPAGAMTEGAAPSGRVAAASPALGGGLTRPIRLFSPPQMIEAIAAAPDGPPVRFTWRRVARRVVRAEGPERIAPPWFSTDFGPTRDYYRVEDEEGRRYWLYREGLYDEVETPRWFVHGLFA
jgi:protein ImuB